MADIGRAGHVELALRQQVSCQSGRPWFTEGIRAAGESRPDSAADSPNLKFGTFNFEVPKNERGSTSHFRAQPPERAGPIRASRSSLQHRFSYQSHILVT